MKLKINAFSFGGAFQANMPFSGEKHIYDSVKKQYNRNFLVCIY